MEFDLTQLDSSDDQCGRCMPQRDAAFGREMIIRLQSFPMISDKKHSFLFQEGEGVV